MSIKRWTSSRGAVYKINRRNGGINMATISFDREIILNEVSAKKLINTIHSSNAKKMVDIDVEEKLAKGKELLNRLFFH